MSTNFIIEDIPTNYIQKWEDSSTKMYLELHLEHVPWENKKEAKLQELLIQHKIPISEVKRTYWPTVKFSGSLDNTGEYTLKLVPSFCGKGKGWNKIKLKVTKLSEDKTKAYDLINAIKEYVSLFK